MLSHLPAACHTLTGAAGGGGEARWLRPCAGSPCACTHMLVLPQIVQVEYEIRAQMLEIYNESLRDLLVSKGSASKLDILNTQASGCNVPAATQVGWGLECVCMCGLLVCVCACAYVSVSVCVSGSWFCGGCG